MNAAIKPEVVRSYVTVKSPGKKGSKSITLYGVEPAVILKHLAALKPSKK